MTEENQEGQQEEINPTEQSAREMGWKPKEEYTGDPGKWVSAEVYVARAPLFDEIERRTKKLKELENVVNNLVQHNTKIEKAAYENAIKTLKANRAAALKEGEFEIAEELDSRIDQIKEEQKTNSFQAPPSGPPSELLEWQAKNDWYNKDPELKEYADFVGRRLATTMGNRLDLTTALKQVTMEVKERFPDKFSNPRRQEAPAVSGRTGMTKSEKKDNLVLTEEETKVMKTFARMGVMTEEQYKEQLKATR